MYIFNTIIQVAQINMRLVQYNKAMEIWGDADPIVSISKSSRKAQSLGHKQYTDLERILGESVG